MIRSAMLFFPRFMILLIITCTQRLLYLASGGVGRRMTLPLRGTGQSSRSLLWPFGLAGAVLAALLLTAADAQGVQRPANDVVAHAGQVLYTTPPGQHDPVFFKGEG